MEDCYHRRYEYETLSDGEEYAICKDCLWICNGFIARLNER